MKAYAVSALTKIYAFEIAAGRKVDLLSEVIAERIRLKFCVSSVSWAFCDGSEYLNVIHLTCDYAL